MGKPGRPPTNYTRSPYAEMEDRAFEIAKDLEADAVDTAAAENPFANMLKGLQLPVAQREPNRVMLSLSIDAATLSKLDKIKHRTGLSRGRILDWLTRVAFDFMQQEQAERADSDIQIKRQSRAFQRKLDVERSVFEAARGKAKKSADDDE